MAYIWESVIRRVLRAGCILIYGRTLWLVSVQVVKKTEETRSVALQISKEEFEKRLSDSIGEFDRKRTGIVAFPVFLMCLRVSTERHYAGS